MYYGHIAGDASQNIDSNFDLIVYGIDKRDNWIKKEIVDFYDNEEYVCYLSRGNKYSRKWDINYSHKETLVLSREYFCEEEDEVVIMVKGIYGSNNTESGWISFCYSKDDAGNIEIKKGAHSSVNYID